MLGFAVGLLNKKVSYYMVNYNQSNNPKNWAYEKVHQTTIDSFQPRYIKFVQDFCYVAYDDCTKIYVFDENDREKP